MAFTQQVHSGVRYKDRCQYLYLLLDQDQREEMMMVVAATMMTITTRPTINVTAINNTATLALDDLKELLTSLESDANITRRSIITDLEAIQLASKTHKAT